METMLDEVCGYLNNWFVKEVRKGEFTFTAEGFDADFLQQNQYFRVVGSVFNDGVYAYPASEMIEETFTGEIWAMAVPPAVIALTHDIEEWQEKYGSASSVNMSPFSSESFNNYSYTKASGGNRGNQSSSSAPLTWKDVYGTKLTRWRRL